jgi:protein-tyrosine phosphatase
LPVDGALSVRISVGDDSMTNLYQHFDTISTTIREEAEQGGVVLVHCVAGVSRSATLCLAYLTKYYCSLGEAWRHVKTIRPWVRPNYSFMEQLVEWEKVVRPHHEGTQLDGLWGAELRKIKQCNESKTIVPTQSFTSVVPSS